MKDYILENKFWFSIILCLTLIIIGSSITFVYFYNEKSCIPCDNSMPLSLNEPIIEEKIVEEKEEIKYIYVDIKGSVKKPGVYKVVDDSIVNDAIKLAGGFLSTAIKENINLSKKIVEEMVIYVYDKNDYIEKDICIVKEEKTETKDITKDFDSDIYIDKDIEEKNSIIIDEDNEEKENTEKSNIVNINSATKEELSELPGVGESKAIAIIEYRKKEGNFKKIEDLMNVSGIGEKTFESFKEFITI